MVLYLQLVNDPRKKNFEFLRSGLISLTDYYEHYDCYVALYTYVIVVQVYLLLSRCLHKDSHFFLGLLLLFRLQRQSPPLSVVAREDFERLRGGHQLLAPFLGNCVLLYQFLFWCNHEVMELIQDCVHG